jgi:hypothetical protein
VSLNIQILGVKEAVAALQGLTPAVRIRHMRIALNAAMGVLKNYTVPPRRTGLLDRSQRVKVVIPQASRDHKHWDRPAYGLLGAGRGLTAVITARGKARILSAKAKATAKAAGTRTVRASRYSHFAEKKYHYLARAVSAGGPDAQAKFASKIAEGINAEAARLASKP